MEQSEETSLVEDLQSQISCLRSRVEELELVNKKLSAHYDSCRCQKERKSTLSDCNLGINEVKLFEETSVKESDASTCRASLNGVQEKSVKLSKKKGRDSPSGFDLGFCQFHPRRYVALKVMYFGKRFYGFASEAQMEPTVESEIFTALQKTRLFVGEKDDLRYSRCGRTDKGVSSIGQVIALFIRSKLKDFGEGEEIDYVRVLNRALPKDIRVMGWCPVPNNFHARFSCLNRKYKYLFWTAGLDIKQMEMAGRKFVGEHDFRNFCKMDAANVHNYIRKITSFEILVYNEKYDNNEVAAIIIEGSAFLWHQVRCMVSVLFMIGCGLETPSVIDALLDLNHVPRKPQYSMANELPLILQSCEFEDLKFTCSQAADHALREHFKTEYQTYILQASIFREALNNICISGENIDTSANNRIHVPLLSRPMEQSYEERRAKLDAKARHKVSTS